MTEPTTQDLIAQYIKIDDTEDVITARHKKELAPYKAAKEAIKAALHLEIERIDAQSIKTSEGTAFKKRTMVVKTADKGVFFDWVLERPQARMELLTAAVSKEPLKEYIDESGNPPPGVDVKYIIEVQVRRPQ